MTFNDVLEIKNGRNQKAVENPNGKYPIYGSGGIIGRADDYICDAQTVIIGRKGNINNPLFVEEPFWNVDTAFGLTAKKEILDSRYLFFFCKNYNFERLNKTVTIPSLTKADLLQIEIALPSLEEQSAVVRKLLSVQEIIRLRTEELNILNNLIKARFVEMFGNPFNERRPAKWCQRPLRELAESISDGSNVDKTLYKSHDEVLFLRIQNVWCNELRLEDSVYISRDENEHYKDTSLKHGDLLITKIGRFYTADSSLGRVSVYLGDDDRANYSNNIMRVRFKSVVNSEYVNALLNLDDYNKYIRRTSVGGTDKRALSKGLIGSFPVIVPPMERQQDFVDYLHQVDKSKAVVQKALDKAQQLFDSLMQEYFG